jgi:hypothetical protein
MILKIIDGFQKSIGKIYFKRKDMFIINLKLKAQEIHPISELTQIQIQLQLL